MTNRKATLRAVAALGSGCLFLTGQPQPAGVFTSAQAEAGRIAYENTCARCHTFTLPGRKGDPGELPPVSSLSEADQKFIGNPKSLSHWRARLFSTAGVTRRRPSTAALNRSSRVLVKSAVMPGIGCGVEPEAWEKPSFEEHQRTAGIAAASLGTSMKPRRAAWRRSLA